MLHFHIAFSLGLIALSSGTALFIFSKHVSGSGLKFVKIIAFLVVILSIISLFCTASSGLRHWKHGYQHCPMEMNKMMQMQDEEGKNRKENKEMPSSMQ